MVNRILSLVGWLGDGAGGRRDPVSRVPAFNNYEQFAKPPGVGRPRLRAGLHLGQWREIAKVFARRQARYGTLAATSVLVVLGILVAINYIGARQNKRWDLTANKQFSLSDQSRNVLAKLDAPLQVLVFAQEPEFPRVSGQAEGIRVRVEEGDDRVHRSRQEADRSRKQNQIQQYGTIVFNYKGRTERVTSDNEQDITNGIIKVVTGQQKKVYFTQGHGEKDTARPNATATTPSPRRSAARTTRSTSWSSRSRARCPTMRRSWSSRGREPTSSRRKSTR